MSFHIKYVFFLILILFLVSCSEEANNYLVAPETEFNFPWETTTAANVGLNQAKIDSAFELAEQKGFVRSILVIKDDKIAAEKYYGYVNQDSWHDLRSATKSFTSAVVGIAVDKGLLNLNDKIAEILPYGITEHADSRINEVTIEQLLQMKSGIGSDDFFATFQSDIVYPNVLQLIMNAPMQADPGTTYLYSSYANFLLTAAIKEVTGRSAMDFADEFLCQPLGISISAWSTDPEGINYGGGGLYLSSRNMAAFGLLYLKNGYVNNQQIISQNWISKSFTDHLGASVDWDVMKDIGYGYLWWMGYLNEYKVYSAMGYGGQYIMLIPELNMIVCATSEAQVSATQANMQEVFTLSLIRDYILP